MGQHALFIQKEVVLNLTRRKSVLGRIISNTGRLAQSVKTYPRRQLGQWVVIANKEYAQAVEEGTKPHWVGKRGLRELERWARLKLGASNPAVVARAVAKKIARKGTKAQPYFEPAVREGERQMRRVFAKIGKMYLKGQ